MRDDDWIRDEFNPGASREQRESAEKLLDEAGSHLDRFLEKRDLGADFRRAQLQGKPRQRAIPVLMAQQPSASRGDHIGLSEIPLPDIRFAEIHYRTPGGIATLLGRIEASVPGRRADDHRGDKLISVAHFHPA